MTKKLLKNDQKMIEKWPKNDWKMTKQWFKNDQKNKTKNSNFRRICARELKTILAHLLYLTHCWQRRVKSKMQFIQLQKAKLLAPFLSYAEMMRRPGYFLRQIFYAKFSSPKFLRQIFFAKIFTPKLFIKFFSAYFFHQLFFANFLYAKMLSHQNKFLAMHFFVAKNVFSAKNFSLLSLINKFGIQ